MEDEIIKKLNDYYTREDFRNKIREIRELQIGFFKDCLNITSENIVRARFLELLENIEKIFPVRLVSKTKSIPSNSIIVSNHLGIAKLAKISAADIFGKDSVIPFFPNDDSFIFSGFPLFFYFLNTKKLPFDSFHTFTIPYHDKDISILQSKLSIYPTNLYGIRQILSSSYLKNLLVFPEGGTSGKRNRQNIYDLDNFNNGYLKLSSKLNMPICPILQILQKDGLYQLIILKSIKGEGAYELKARMQNEINKVLANCES